MTLKILVVDDEPDLEPLILQRFRKQIRAGEMEFAFAHDGREAIQRLDDDPGIELVLSDINMPVMDGLTLLTKLNEMPRVLKTVMVSAYNDMLNLRTAMNRGAYDFVTKPIDFEDLENTVRKTSREIESLREAKRTREQLDLIEAELNVAARIQQSLLPAPLVSENGVEIAATMLPARHVSGDFYDFFPLGEDRVGLVIGDVSGKGIPSALFMAVARTVLRTSAFQGAAPDECLTAVNRVLAPQGGGQMYVTLFYGILDTVSGRLTWSVGGHAPPWIISASGEPRQIEGQRGFMVGMFDQASFDSTETQLSPGDIVILQTDGVTDAENPSGEMLGKARTAELMGSLTPGDPAVVVRAIVERVREFTAGAPQADDITLLSARWKGEK